ncbi:hypothetical protein [Bradyrhizobium valentinum]|uniref:Uncharacterized protein n=1 Tax=Bradyrhizobium valentinum TaxID=1518501 RepID=A0A0R3L5X1_9BRAD|nr:hypothetical protein [Bradyrhizobium valentinum]KRR03194.1 hypothetical protein CP49_04465 [Bradyrhizobium valentinum]
MYRNRTSACVPVRRYRLHLVSSGVGVTTINQTVSTLHFFFTLRRYDIVVRRSQRTGVIVYFQDYRAL